MATAVKKPAQKQAKKPAQKKENIDVRHRIKPRGLVGMFKGAFVLNGTDEEVFSLNRLAKVQ